MDTETHSLSYEIAKIKMTLDRRLTEVLEEFNKEYPGGYFLK